MPRVTDVYYSLLLKALTNGQYGSVELTEEAMAAAMRSVEQQIQAMSPNPDDLDSSFNGFAARQRQQQSEIYGRLRPDSNTIGPDNESRYDYAQRCRTEVMKSVKRRVLQELEWRNATARLGLYDENHQLKQINTNRFLNRLIKTGGTAEDRQYNDAIVALTALANGDITEEKYLELRKKHHAAVKKSDDTPEELAKRDLKNGAEFILREVEQEIGNGSENHHRYQSAVAAIQSGNYSGFQNGMEEAFDIFNNNAVELQMVGKEIFGFLNKLGLENPSKDRQEKMRKEWLDRAFDVLQIREAAEQVANPYFALLDPFKLYRAFNAQSGGLLPYEKDRQPQDALAYALLESAPEYQVTAGRALSRLGLRRCALDAGDEILEERLPGFSVFHKDDRTLILKLGHANDNGIVSAEIDTSGEFFRQGLHDEAQALLERCNGWSTEKRTSRQFEDMRDALENVAGMHLSEKLTEEEFILAGERFGELLWSTQEYLAHKLEQHPDKNWSGTYERERVEFANRVLEFARKKLRHLDYLGEQKNTLAMRDAAERDMPGPLAPERNVPKYAGMSSLQYKLAKDKEKVQAQAQQQPPQAQQQQQPQVHAAKKDISKDFGALTQDLAGASKDSAAAKKKIEVSIQGNDVFCINFKRAIDTGKTLTGAKVTQADKDNLLQMFRENTARRAVSELVSAEQEKQKQNPKAAVQVPFTQIVNAGKADQLAERIAESDAFKRLLGEYFHDDNIEIMPKLGNTKEFRAMCAQAGREFFTGVMMDKLVQAHKAKQEQKDDVLGQNAPEDEKRKGEEKKEAKPAADAPENQNRINIINEDEDDELEEEFKRNLKGILSEAREVQSRIGTTAVASMQTHCIRAHESFRNVMAIRQKDDAYGIVPKTAKTVLATEVLQYMLTQESAGGVLANAVEKGQLSDLQDAIRCSDAFTESFHKFDWEKKLGRDWAAENQFCRQVGDALLRSAMPMLREEAPLVAKQKAVEKGTPADRRHFNDSLKAIFYDIEKWKKEDWAREAAENGEEHPAQDYLSRQIENEIEKYEQLGEKGGEHLQTALAGLILTGMMSDKCMQGVFEAAVEYGKYPQLIEMIRTSPLFKATIGKLDPADTEKVEKYVENPDDYLLPLGERIMQMSGETLKDARFQVLDMERSHLYKEAFTEAEAASKAGTQPSEKVVERARESVALSAVFGLLSYGYDTNEHLSNEELRKIAYDSKEFKETLANRDLHDPTQIKEVCDWRPGHQFPMGFLIGGDIVSRMNKEKRSAEQQKREEAQKAEKAKSDQKGGKVI